MSIINEACGSTATTVKNIGARVQCFEGLLKTGWLAKETFSFASVAEAKTRAAAITAISGKNLGVLPYVADIQPANTEPTFKDTLYNGKYELTKAIVGDTIRIDTSVCTQEALKTYAKAGYSRMFQLTDSNELLCDVQADGTVKGRRMSSFLVGLRNGRTTGDLPFTNLTINYEDESFSVLKTDSDLTELEGILDVVIKEVSASTTSVKFTVETDCGGSLVTNLTSSDVTFLDSSGDPQAGTFVVADGDGVYEYTGTGFESNSTISLDGVVVQGEVYYESPTPLTITVV